MTQVTIIKPSKGLLSIDLKEIWRFRELLWTLAERDIKVRYKQTLIGGVWAILQPFLTMIVFSFFFGKIAKMPSEGVPYPIFSYSGLILWTFFTAAITAASNSMVGSANIITKVYFPRLIIPTSSIITGVIDYAIAFIMMLLLILYYHFPITPSLLFIPFILFGTLLL